jgi:hypothetical protein
MKIRILNESFYQGKDTTVCTLECKVVVEESSIYHQQPCELEKIIRNHFEQQPNFGHDCGYLGHYFTVKASTKCKGDKFDEVKGKRIAESKCKRNIYKFYLRLYNSVCDEILNKDIKLLNQHIDNLFYCVNREDKHLKELMQ